MDKINNLYIIGNGFDLHHGFKTSYKDFKQYLEKNNRSELLKLINEHLYFSSEDLWSNFEESLGDMYLFEFFEG